MTEIKSIWKKINKLSVTEKWYDDMFTLISTGEIENVTAQYRYRLKRYLPYFDVVGNELIFQTSEPLPGDLDVDNKEKNYIVVRPSQKDEILQAFYDNICLGSFKGVRNIYKKLKERYIGFTVKDVQKLISKQELVQIYTPVTHLISSPIITTKPLERWEVDLMDFQIISITE